MADFRIIITSCYGVLAKGRHWAWLNDYPEKLASKNEAGQLVITEPGTWILHCSYGLKAKAKATLIVDEIGSWEMTGEKRMFTVIGE